MKNKEKGLDYIGRVYEHTRQYRLDQCLPNRSVKSYVIGGSEEANEEIRNKYLGDDYKLPDQAKSYYELNAKGISRLELTSENYNDIMKIKGMPSSCLSGSYGGQVIQNMKDMMDSYYSGKCPQRTYNRR